MYVYSESIFAYGEKGSDKLCMHEGMRIISYSCFE